MPYVPLQQRYRGTGYPGKIALLNLVLQRKPFAFEVFFCLANAEFFPLSSKTLAACAYANEMLMRLGRSLDENLIIFVKLRSSL